MTITLHTGSSTLTFKDVEAVEVETGAVNAEIKDGVMRLEDIANEKSPI